MLRSISDRRWWAAGRSTGFGPGHTWWITDDYGCLVAVPSRPGV